MNAVRHIEDLLKLARAEAAEAVDRAEALVELRGLAYEFAARPHFPDPRRALDD